MKYWFIVFTSCLVFIYADVVPFFANFQPHHQSFNSYDIQNLANAYYKNHYENVTPSTKPRIPKIIHLIWLGSSLPKLFEKYVQSWRDHHPDWTVKLWLEEDVFSFPFVTGDKINQSKNHGQRSDIFRYEILYRYGGLYADVDFLCLKPHDILHHTCNFYASMSPFTVYNGLMAASPKHPIVKICLDTINQIPEFGTESNDIMTQTGPFLLTRSLLHALENGEGHGVICYHPAYFYSFPAVKRFQFWNADEAFSIVQPHLFKDAFAVHLWATSWSPEFSLKEIEKFIRNPYNAAMDPKRYQDLIKKMNNKKR